MVIFLVVDGVEVKDVSVGNRGWLQSELFGSLAFLPVVLGNRRCLAGGSWCGFATIETKSSVLSVGRFKLRM